MSTKSSIRLFRTTDALAKALKAGRGTVGFVPTMGALHAGHLSLVRRALGDCSRVVVSIFVNPTQFGPKEDFAKYPRDLAGDCALLSGMDKVHVFAPGPDEVYPPDFATRIHVGGSLGSLWEGELRPGHFDGVATVVARLFGMVRPDRAYFGSKDHQQFRVIERMVKDLGLPLQVTACPTEREADGLAMSSRNRYLGPADRNVAPLIHRALVLARNSLRQGASVAKAEALGRGLLKGPGRFEIQYFTVVDARTLAKPLGNKGSRVILAAVKLGGTRLIDNIKV